MSVQSVSRNEGRGTFQNNTGSFERKKSKTSPECGRQIRQENSVNFISVADLGQKETCWKFPGHNGN